MEPDDYETVQRVLGSNQTYTYSTAASSVKSKDLSQFSTRELLNEAYRRGAIRPFSQRFRVAPYMFKDEAESSEYMKHVHQTVVRDLLIGNADTFQKYGAIDMTTKDFTVTHQESVIEAEIYICKHPKIIKKAGG